MTAAPNAQDLLKNPFVRRVVGPGTVAWTYAYRNETPLPIPAYVSSALELGVQLAGEWWHEGSRAGARVFRPGMVHTISPSERFRYSFAARGEIGRLVGFTVYPREAPELGSGDLVFSPQAARFDRRLFQLCRAIDDAEPRGEEVDPSEIRDVLLRFVRANCEAKARDALDDARDEIERTYDRPMYVRHVAGVAGRHPVTFSRAFIERFGVTPTRYRLEMRINAAVRLAWSRHDLSIRTIAEQVGFEDVSYLHRAFVTKFGMTPAQIGRRPIATGIRRSRRSPKLADLA